MNYNLCLRSSSLSDRHFQQRRRRVCASIFIIGKAWSQHFESFSVSFILNQIIIRKLKKIAKSHLKSLTIFTSMLMLMIVIFQQTLFVMKALTKQLFFSILQSTKRLRTFPMAQEAEIIQINKQVFEQAALLKLIRLKDSFLQLAQNQKIGKIDIQFTGLNRLEVATNNGNFVLQARSDLSTLFYTSPSTGTYKYYYDTQQERFISNKDGHLLDENLSRQAHRHFGDILPL